MLPLIARPWLQPQGHAVFLARDVACFAAITPGLLVAVAFWVGADAARTLGGAALLIAAMAGAWIPFDGAALALIALPTFAALQRASGNVIIESRVAGAGALRIAVATVLPLAAPGLIYGALLCLAPYSRVGDWRVVAACLPLVLIRVQSR